MLAHQKGGPAGDLKPALDLDHPADVRSVAGTALGKDLVLDGVEFATELGDLLVREVRRRGRTDQRAAGLRKGTGPRLYGSGAQLALGSFLGNVGLVRNNRHAVVLLRGRG